MQSEITLMNEDKSHYNQNLVALLHCVRRHLSHQGVDIESDLAFAVFEELANHFCIASKQPSDNIEQLSNYYKNLISTLLINIKHTGLNYESRLAPVVARILLKSVDNVEQ